MRYDEYGRPMNQSYANTPYASLANIYDRTATIQDPNAQPKKKQVSIADLAKGVGTTYAVKGGLKEVTGALTGGGAAASAAPGALTGGAIDSAGAAMGAPTGLGGLSEAAAPGAFSLSGIGSAGNAFLPAAGVMGLADLASHRKRIGTGAGYLEGAASGAAMGSFFGPIGMGVGAGLGLLGNALGIGHQSRTKEEEHQREKLAEQGIVVPNSDVKEWELNDKFKQSRNEADLTGKDIIHASDFYAGIPGYGDLDPAKQEAIANKALEVGAIRERLGKIEVGDNADLNAFIQSQIGGGNTGGGDSRKQQSENKKARKRAALADIVNVDANVTRGPDYGANPGALITNPYL